MLARAGVTLLLLTLSNTFMNVAWYGHLKFKEAPIWTAVLASWGIALIEYCVLVPTTRYGYEGLSVTQLKVIQEITSVGSFAVFALIVFKEKLTTNHAISFAFLVLAAYFAVRK
ncbi:MAG: hypothetical protein AMXMBFR81_21750 [Chthonomonas sp.]|nr:DMT family protein [Fimbriimonadaceae bacterium]